MTDLLTRAPRREPRSGRRAAGAAVATGGAPTALVDAGSRAPAEVLASLASTPTGLTSAEATGRLARSGPNLISQRRITALDVLRAQLRNPLLWLLLGAAAVSGLTGDPAGAVIIAVIVLLSVGLGFVNEYRSARALAALHGDIHYSAVAWRDGARDERRRHRARAGRRRRARRGRRGGG